jgi:uncharacterized membrane protein
MGANYHFSAYRADITRLGLVGPGTTTLTVSGFDFATGASDENKLAENTAFAQQHLKPFGLTVMQIDDILPDNPNALQKMASITGILNEPLNVGVGSSNNMGDPMNGFFEDGGYQF